MISFLAWAFVAWICVIIVIHALFAAGARVEHFLSQRRIARQHVIESATVPYPGVYCSVVIWSEAASSPALARPRATSCVAADAEGSRLGSRILFYPQGI
jgi:hypothetical protein